VLETDLPDDDWDTLGGLVFNTLGHVPTEGEHITTHGWRFTVREMDGRRIKQVEVTREVVLDDAELADAEH
jgi:magnesium and cobalt transporter